MKMRIDGEIGEIHPPRRSRATVNVNPGPGILYSLTLDDRDRGRYQVVSASYLFGPLPFGHSPVRPLTRSAPNIQCFPWPVSH